MPSVTHDGRSFMIDGKRIWLVSGQVPYARIPRHRWRERIAAARHAGLNTIETPVFWNRHEPRPGKFDFGGENDLRHFVELVGNAGLYCILGLGPYVDEGWDLGGLPPWIADHPTAKLRAANGPFLEACSRFITTAVDQVRSLQVTSAGAGGPIVLAQCEANWTCGVDALGEAYLGELTRYLREAGLTVPIINGNNLWCQVEGQLDAWAGNEEMLASMRQMAAVRPGQPRLVVAFDTARQAVWGKPSPVPLPAAEVQRRLAEILGAGAQFNIRAFCGGRNPGFWGGRSPEGPDEFYAVDADLGAVITASGEPGESYHAVRRVTHFASRFGRVFANLDPAFQPVSIDPIAPGGIDPRTRGKGVEAEGISVVHVSGTQGAIAFLFGPRRGYSPARQASLVLPDGSTLPVWMGRQGLGWCLFDVLISGRAQLDYCNANLFASLGDVLVAFAPAGSSALLSINASPVEVPVPTGERPEIVSHEGLTIALVNEDAIDRVFVAEDAVYFGIAGLTPDGAPIALPGSRQFLRVSADGKQKNVPADQTRSASPARIAMTPWQMSAAEDYVDGTSARYAAIEGPADLSTLGCPFGYGWYRLTVGADRARRLRLGFPHAADRLHVFHSGSPAALLGAGPGAHGDTMSLGLEAGEQQVVILAENMGRFSGGVGLGEKKGLYGDIYEVAPARAGKARVVRGAPLDALSFASPLWEVREGDTTSPQRLSWTVSPKRKGPLIVNLGPPPSPGVLFLNDAPLAYFDVSGPVRHVIPVDRLKRGANVIQVALMAEASGGKDIASMARQVGFSEGIGSFTARADMAFAKWEAPAGSTYGPLRAVSVPAWFRCTFTVPDATRPLALRMAGVSKGQLYVNGRHVCRYFVATPGGKSVPPQDTYVIPASFLKAGQANELALFDEHGKVPSRCRLLPG